MRAIPTHSSQILDTDNYAIDFGDNMFVHIQAHKMFLKMYEEERAIRGKISRWLKVYGETGSTNLWKHIPKSVKKETGDCISFQRPQSGALSVIG